MRLISLVVLPVPAMPCLTSVCWSWIISICGTNLTALAVTEERVLKESDVQLFAGAYFSLKMHVGDINADLLALMERCQMSDAIACICLLDN